MSFEHRKDKFDNRNLNEKIYLYLRQLIISNVIKPGTRLDYSTLSKKLGVSKTPIRDAFHFLERDGLVEIRSRSGTFVSIPQEKDIIEVYDIRKALERQAVAAAAKHLKKEKLMKLLDEVNEAERAIKKNNFQPFFQSDRNLHKTIIEHSGNRRLMKIFQSIEAQIAWLGVIISKTSERPSIASISHRKILTALLNGEIETAQQLMEEHIESIKQMTLNEMK